MITVSVLANIAHVTADTVRHYVKLGLLHPRRDGKNGYQLFSQDDIDSIKFIIDAKSLGFSLKEISKNIPQGVNSALPDIKLQEILEKNIEENQQRLDSLLAQQKRMKSALMLSQRMPENVPFQVSVSNIIDSLAGV